MPGGDRTGPAGFGPRTGRGMGYCSGFDAPGYFNAGFGRPFGAGRGGGRGRGGGGGRCIRFWPAWPGVAFGPYQTPAPSPELEMENLEQMAESLEAQLKSIKARIMELKSE
jgi:hypothetical protein